LGTASAGNDCWGYTSPSGREYALMGIRNAMVIVEVTTPASPQIIASIPHIDTLWCDVKVYGTRAYVV
ncbi:MAG: regulator, partial [Acidobacteria bacterium]|nr:regulator [Acidobacteriota bacterium]